MKRYAIPSVILLVLVAFGVWWFSPTQVLKRRCASLLSTLTLDAGSGNMGRQAGAYSLNALLAQEVELDTPTIKEANGNFDRSELESAYSWLSSQAKQTRFELVAFDSVTINGDSGRAELRLIGLVELPTYRPVDGTFDVVLDWKKEKDGWRLTRAGWNEVP